PLDQLLERFGRRHLLRRHQRWHRKTLFSNHRRSPPRIHTRLRPSRNQFHLHLSQSRSPGIPPGRNRKNPPGLLHRTAPHPQPSRQGPPLKPPFVFNDVGTPLLRVPFESPSKETFHHYFV